jgi:uncharacterized membrane protein YdbT with pleckstrin-like domain
MKTLRFIFKRIGPVVMLLTVLALAGAAVRQTWLNGSVSAWGPIAIAVILVFLVRAVLKLFGYQFKEDDGHTRRRRRR